MFKEIEETNSKKLKKNKKNKKLMSQQILPMRKQKSKIIKLKSIITTKKFTLGIQ